MIVCLFELFGSLSLLILIRFISIFLLSGYRFIQLVSAPLLVSKCMSHYSPLFNFYCIIPLAGILSIIAP